ncbi:HD domain-containing protein, partial [Desulfovibrio sp. OttesenSCG-928-I05]|nr:HD domain-containing protein [Desulfovibrio sp. OttesenSCG-928-I05]
ELEPRLKPVDEALWERFLTYVHTTKKDTLADRILDAAHHYASYWEFRLIKSLNGFDEELPGIEESFRVRLKSHADLHGVSELLDEDPSSAFRNFVTLCGQLRFQKRWSQTPRIPETSVLGHMFLVACYAYFFSLGVGACPARRMNNFFAGLLHDLPEVLTRDIIFPVKKSISGLDELIRDYEEHEVSRRILTPLQRQGFSVIVDRLRYFLGLDIGSEFYESIRIDGVTQAQDFNALQTTYNEDRFDPKDGTLLKTCDSLAAFIEAYTAVRNGIASDQLQQAIWRLREDNRHKEFGPLHVGALFADFD